MSDGHLHCSGWVPDVPDPRDYHIDSQPVLESLARLRPCTNPYPDLREFFAEDIGCPKKPHLSTAHACLALLRYLGARSTGACRDPSVDFLDAIARRDAGSRGDTGSGIRSTLRVIRRFGLPPNRLWRSSRNAETDKLLDPMLYAYAKEYQTLVYFRLDARPNNESWMVNRSVHDSTLLEKKLKSFLSAGFPVLFGFAAPHSVLVQRELEIECGEALTGGQAAVAVGCDSQHLIFRSCLGARWGNDGFGRLPIEFIHWGYATNFWSAFVPERLTDDFARPTLLPRGLT